MEFTIGMFPIVLHRNVIPQISCLTFNVVFVELVALLHRTEASILADSPRPVCVHGWVGSSSERFHPRQLLRKVFCVPFGVQGLDVDPLWGVPD